jgi:hypothetical protein
MKLFIILLLSLIFPIQALACACCAERGTYSIRTTKPDNYVLDELKRLQTKTTNLYTDNGYPETIKGISPLGESFTSSFLFQNKIWKFDFVDNNNKKGSLNLPMPTSMVDFRVDTYNEGEPILYKELRFKFKLKSGSGIFSKGFSPANEYFLVFQGKGNNCTNAEDFSHWRLEITGAKANYAFFGELKTKE